MIINYMKDNKIFSTVFMINQENNFNKMLIYIKTKKIKKCFKIDKNQFKISNKFRNNQKKIELKIKEFIA